MKLNAEERHLFRLVSEATCINPFGKRRDELDYQIAGISKKTAQEDILPLVLKSLRKKLQHLEDRGKARIDLYEEKDQSLLKFAVLFETFHRYQNCLDLLIANQEKNSSSLPVPFASEVLSVLKKYGFDPEISLRAFAIFFQLRRGYFFINHNVLGISPCMLSLKERIWNNLFTTNLMLYENFLWNRMEDFSTLLLGETGTGKGTIAKTIGMCSYIPFNPKTQQFVESFGELYLSTNLSQFSENLIESELFGHCKGAFTGAIAQYHGILSRCRPFGAIFLDEVGETSIPIQIKLLRVLEERTFSPVGSSEQNRFSGRIIAATNKPLSQLLNNPYFRNDFYYRLSTDCIEVPTLRQRLSQDREEFNLLIHSIITKTIGTESKSLLEMVQKSLSHSLSPEYPWPGNVRELEQCVRRILLTGVYEGVSQSNPTKDFFQNQFMTGTLSAIELLSGYCKLLYNQYGTYNEVAERTGLDRRTVKKYVNRSDNALSGRKQG